MSEKALYRLNPATVVEPLVHRWPAWSHLISPIPGSLHLSNYQIKVLQSYLDDPKSHAETCRDVRLRSGPFVDIAVEKAGEVEKLLAEMQSASRDRIALAGTVTEFHNKLVREARGQSLTPFYKAIPDAIRGCAELVYDYYNRPSVRFFEGLLYESPYYATDLQSFRLFRQSTDGGRAFFMSTPRLAGEVAGEEQIDWVRPFASAAVDELFQLDSLPRPLGEIRELLGMDAEMDAKDEGRLLELLSGEAPAPVDRPRAGEIRLRYFGHACVLIECDGLAILTDACVAVRPRENGIDRFTYQDLPPRIDYALVTHNHHDHFCMETLLRLRHKIGCLVVPKAAGTVYGDLSLKLLARKVGFKHVMEIEALETIPLPDGEIIAAPFMGEHADLAHSKTAYVLRLGRRSFLFAADSDCLDKRLYERLRGILGRIQTVFIGMECVGAPLSWSCGPFLPIKPDFNQERTRRYKGCDSARALEILEALGASELYIYAMGLEPWLEYLLGLALSEDSEQLKQARALIAQTRARGFTTSKMLFGKDEFHYSPRSH